MKSILIVSVITVTITISILSLAGEPKQKSAGENRLIFINTSPITGLKSPVTLNHYSVTAIDATDNTLYDISTLTNPSCGTTPADSPCDIETPLTLGSTVSRYAVDNQINSTIMSKQPQL